MCVFLLYNLYNRVSRAQLEPMDCLDHQVTMGYQELKGGLAKV